MGRSKKDYKVQSIRMDEKIADRLDKFCEVSGQTKTFIIEQAVVRYMNDFEKLYKKMNTENK